MYAPFTALSTEPFSSVAAKPVYVYVPATAGSTYVLSDETAPPSNRGRVIQENHHGEPGVAGRILGGENTDPLSVLIDQTAATAPPISGVAVNVHVAALVADPTLIR